MSHGSDDPVSRIQMSQECCRNGASLNMDHSVSYWSLIDLPAHSTSFIIWIVPLLVFWMTEAGLHVLAHGYAGQGYTADPDSLCDWFVCCWRQRKYYSTFMKSPCLKFPHIASYFGFYFYCLSCKHHNYNSARQWKCLVRVWWGFEDLKDEIIILMQGFCRSTEDLCVCPLFCYPVQQRRYPDFMFYNPTDWGALKMNASTEIDGV